jgi:hypothetical protein
MAWERGAAKNIAVRLAQISNALRENKVPTPNASFLGIAAITTSPAKSLTTRYTFLTGFTGAGKQRIPAICGINVSL